MALAKGREVARQRFVVSLTFEAFDTHTPADLVDRLQALPHGAHIVSGAGTDVMTVDLVPEDADIFGRTVPFASIENDDGLELLGS